MPGAPKPLVHRATQWGDDVGKGQFGARRCGLDAVGKPEISTDGSTRVVGNEFLANRLALSLGYSVPAGALLLDDEKRRWFISLHFGPAGENPPPVIVKTLADAFAPTALGSILVFDAWIANHDRHVDNIAVSEGSLALFDHGLAFGGPAMPTLNSQPEPCLPLQSHVLASVVNSSAAVSQAQEMIRRLGPELVRIHLDTLKAAGVYNATQTTVLRNWMNDRTACLDEILKASLPEIDDWGLET